MVLQVCIDCTENSGGVDVNNVANSPSKSRDVPDCWSLLIVGSCSKLLVRVSREVNQLDRGDALLACFRVARKHVIR